MASAYVMGRTPEFRPEFRYECFKCGYVTRLNAARWAHLPEVSWSELRQHDEFWRVETDLRGHGVTDEQIAQLEAAGIGTDEIGRQPMSSPPPAPPPKPRRRRTRRAAGAGHGG